MEIHRKLSTRLESIREILTSEKDLSLFEDVLSESNAVLTRIVRKLEKSFVKPSVDLTTFLEYEVVEEDGAQETFSSILSTYNKWAKTYGAEQLDLWHMGTRLSTLGYVKSHTHGSTYYTGIRLRTEPKPMEHEVGKGDGFVIFREEMLPDGEKHSYLPDIQKWIFGTYKSIFFTLHFGSGNITLFSDHPKLLTVEAMFTAYSSAHSNEVKKVTLKEFREAFSSVYWRVPVSARYSAFKRIEYALFEPKVEKD